MLQLKTETVWTLPDQPLSQLAETAKRISSELHAADPFVLWMEGPLGAGKTTIAGEILWQLGLSRAQPVTSPTFTYFNEYKLNQKRYYHCDFYRGGAKLTWEEVGISWPDEGGGFLVEWPTEGPMQTELSPTHILKISYGAAGDGSTRSYELSRIV